MAKTKQQHKTTLPHYLLMLSLIADTCLSARYAKDDGAFPKPLESEASPCFFTFYRTGSVARSTKKKAWGKHFARKVRFVWQRAVWKRPAPAKRSTNVAILFPNQVLQAIRCETILSSNIILLYAFINCSNMLIFHILSILCVVRSCVHIKWSNY